MNGGHGGPFRWYMYRNGNVVVATGTAKTRLGLALTLRRHQLTFHLRRSRLLRLALAAVTAGGLIGGTAAGIAAWITW